MSDMYVDYVVVGAGAAGCVLAGRLSERSNKTILLIEAGTDTPPGREPASILDPYPRSHGDRRFLWPNLIAEVGADPGNGQARFSRPYAQGRIMGGGSSIMGMISLRGHPGDFDEWEGLGATGWAWRDVLPFFNRVERDLDFDGPQHGREGPIPIRRNKRSEWPPFCRAVGEALECRGYPFVPDYNSCFDDGVSAIPMNNLPHQRVSSAMAYLGPAVRGRPNLRILTDTYVEALLHEGRRITGVKVRTQSGPRRFMARETIVSAGALHSPTILLRSGIGPAKTLQGLGIEVVSNLPGVGTNLLNHPHMIVATHLQPRATQPHHLKAWGFSCLRYSSNYHDCPCADMFMAPLNKASWHPLGRRIGLMVACVYKSFSRGDVTLRSGDPYEEPRVRFNLLSDERDMARLVDGLRLCFSLLAETRFAAVRNEVFLPKASIATRLDRPGFVNWLQGSLIAQTLDGPAALRRVLLGDSVVDPAYLAANREALQEMVIKCATPTHHVCGTCKIGPAHDPTSVVDARCRIHGVEGLRIVDASIMPSIVRANTHLPVLMIGERAADLIQSDND